MAVHGFIINITDRPWIRFAALGGNFLCNPSPLATFVTFQAYPIFAMQMALNDIFGGHLGCLSVGGWPVVAKVESRIPCGIKGR
jgi:hypothetical protein